MKATIRKASRGRLVPSKRPDDPTRGRRVRAQRQYRKPHFARLGSARPGCADPAASIPQRASISITDAHKLSSRQLARNQPGAARPYLNFFSAGWLVGMWPHFPPLLHYDQQQPRARHRAAQRPLPQDPRPRFPRDRQDRIISRTAVYGPVCTVAWEGRGREAPPLSRCAQNPPRVRHQPARPRSPVRQLSAYFQSKVVGPRTFACSGLPWRARRNTLTASRSLKWFKKLSDRELLSATFLLQA